MAWGFAAFLRFMKIVKTDEGAYTGNFKDREYNVTDSQAEYFCKIWENSDVNAVVEIVLMNKELWETDLTKLPGFKDAVAECLSSIVANNVVNYNTDLK